ncbi:hypothetical protein RJT34_04051 [Clitoria ternatea]|uniref:FAD-binding PCMH-type domain-containing protein n=1 Tax=Clitoria ternatea TaxID=43366 RepID=A0AAN9KKW9_CLITE
MARVSGSKRAWAFQCIQIRSGGHDFEGLLYVAKVPFIIVDLINLNEIEIDVNKRIAWVQSRATVGELYYRIGEKSKTLGFPTGVYPTVGIDGHFSGGGYGLLMRKYGLAANNVIDAHIIDVNSKLLDRESIGEDLFWAIRGGGGASFGVIVAWKVKLVSVPSTLMVSQVNITLEKNATQIIHMWQFLTNKIDEGLGINIVLHKVNLSKKKEFTIEAVFQSLFLEGVDELLHLMQKNFPKLGSKREDCTGMSWVESLLYLFGLGGQPLELLLNRTQAIMGSFKTKSDFLRNLIPETGLEGL